VKSNMWKLEMKDWPKLRLCTPQWPDVC